MNKAKVFAALFAMLVPSACVSPVRSAPAATTNVSPSNIPVVNEPEIWKDPNQPLDARVHDLVRRLSLTEKSLQLCSQTAPIPRLGIPGYTFRNECLHGLVNGVSTQCPQAIGMAATWD